MSVTSHEMIKHYMKAGRNRQVFSLLYKISIIAAPVRSPPPPPASEESK